MQYSVEPRTRKYVKGYELLSFSRKYKKNNYWIQGQMQKKVVHKAGKYLGNNVAESVLPKTLAT